MTCGSHVRRDDDLCVCPERIDVDAAAPREASVDGEPLASAARRNVDEDPFDAILVKSRMPAIGDEVAKESRAIDLSTAVADHHVAVVRLCRDRAARPEERRTQRFLVNLIFDPEYDGYVADVPQLPGCMSQGKTVEAALTNVRKAIRAHLNACRLPR